MSEIVRLPFALVILLYQSIALALSQIWANKVRGILTTLGILIGVAAVSAVITLLSGMNTWVLHEFEALGTNRILVFAHRPAHATHFVSYGQLIFKPGNFDGLLENCPSLEKVTRIDEWHDDPITFRSKVEQDNVRVYGADPAWHDVEHRS